MFLTIIYYLKFFYFSCCNSQYRINSCTFPTSFVSSLTGNFTSCPTPPFVSLYSNTAGPLATANTFVDEYILRLAEKVGQDFFRQYQAGFTTAYSSPTISGCDCIKANGKSIRGCSLFNELGTGSCEPKEGCSEFGLINLATCPLKPFNESGLCKTNPKCYSIEPYSLDYFYVSQIYHLL